MAGIREVDYTLICDCGWERSETTLRDAKELARRHLFARESDRCKTVFIDRNVDKEIDDSFRTRKVTRKSETYWRGVIMR